MINCKCCQCPVFQQQHIGHETDSDNKTNEREVIIAPTTGLYINPNCADSDCNFEL